MIKKYYCIGCSKYFNKHKPKGENSIKCPKCFRAITVVGEEHPLGVGKE